MVRTRLGEIFGMGTSFQNYSWEQIIDHIDHWRTMIRVVAQEDHALWEQIAEIAGGIPYDKKYDFSYYVEALKTKIEKATESVDGTYGQLRQREEALFWANAVIALLAFAISVMATLGVLSWVRAT